MIAGALRVMIKADGQNFPVKARVVAEDKSKDLALLKLEGLDRDFSFLNFGKSRSLKVGQNVFAVGNPFGYGNSVSRGIVSATNRQLERGKNRSFLQTDAPLNPGNSGGPLLNLKGEVVGVNTALVADAQGISFSIPSDEAQVFLREHLSNSNTRSIIRSFESLVLAEEKDEKGLGLLRVTNIRLGSPFLKAGLQLNDRLLSANGASMNTKQDWSRISTDLGTNGSLNLTIRRKGDNLVFRIPVQSLSERDSARRTGTQPGAL